MDSFHKGNKLINNSINSHKIIIDAFQNNDSLYKSSINNNNNNNNNKVFNLFPQNPIKSFLLLRNERADHNNNSTTNKRVSKPKLMLKSSLIQKYHLKSTRPLSNRIINNNDADNNKNNTPCPHYLEVNNILSIIHPNKRLSKQMSKSSFNNSLSNMMSNSNSCKNFNATNKDQEIQVNLSPIKSIKDYPSIKYYNRSFCKNNNKTNSKGILSIVDCIKNEKNNYSYHKRIKSSIRFTNKSTCSSFKFSPRVLFD